MSPAGNYVLVTLAYWAFTLTDGALRMLVLLHFNQLGYTPVQLAFLFLLYEFFGIVTNLVGGWLAARTGLRLTLVAGLTLQVVALGLLALLQHEWSTALSVAGVVGCSAGGGGRYGRPVGRAWRSARRRRAAGAAGWGLMTRSRRSPTVRARPAGAAGRRRRAPGFTRSRRN